jgi:hypothetical protein
MFIGRRSPNTPHTCVLFGMMVVSTLFAQPGNFGKKDENQIKEHVLTMLESKGITRAQYERLKTQGLISEGLENAAPADVDLFSVNDKYLLADAVIYGVISDVQYLYKEGGMYLTKYIIAVKNRYKGTVADFISIVSPDGPYNRSHSTLAGTPPFVIYDMGNEGFFFLKRVNQETIKKDCPACSRSNCEIFKTVREQFGVYLFKDGTFDSAYAKEVGLDCSLVSVKDLENIFQKLETALSAGK